MSRRLVVLVGVLLVLGQGRANAELVGASAHAETSNHHAYGSAIGRPPVGVWVSVSEIDPYGNIETANSVAYVYDPPYFMSLYANASSSIDELRPTTWASGAWHDVFSGDDTPLPTSITLHWTVQGEFRVFASGGEQAMAWSGLGIATYPGRLGMPSFFFPDPLYGRDPNAYDLAAWAGLEADGTLVLEACGEFSDYQFSILPDPTGGWQVGFSGAFYLDIPYDSSLGGYEWSIGATVDAVTAAGAVMSNFHHTAIFHGSRALHACRPGDHGTGRTLGLEKAQEVASGVFGVRAEWHCRVRKNDLSCRTLGKLTTT